MASGGSGLYVEGPLLYTSVYGPTAWTSGSQAFPRGFSPNL